MERDNFPLAVVSSSIEPQVAVLADAHLGRVSNGLVDAIIDFGARIQNRP